MHTAVLPKLPVGLVYKWKLGLEIWGQLDDLAICNVVAALFQCRTQEHNNGQNRAEARLFRTGYIHQPNKDDFSILGENITQFWNVLIS